MSMQSYYKSRDIIFDLIKKKSNMNLSDPNQLINLDSHVN